MSTKGMFSLIKVFQFSYQCILFLFGYIDPKISNHSSLWWMSRSQTPLIVSGFWTRNWKTIRYTGQDIKPILTYMCVFSNDYWKKIILRKTDYKRIVFWSPNWVPLSWMEDTFLHLKIFSYNYCCMLIKPFLKRKYFDNEE